VDAELRVGGNVTGVVSVPYLEIFATKIVPEGNAIMHDGDNATPVPEGTSF
jgi:hypothetical protein